jgi:hypothetical protein
MFETPVIIDKMTNGTVTIFNKRTNKSPKGSANEEYEPRNLEKIIPKIKERIICQCSFNLFIGNQRHWRKNEVGKKQISQANIFKYVGLAKINNLILVSKIHLNNTISQHGFGNFYKARHICSFYIVNLAALIAIF